MTKTILEDLGPSLYALNLLGLIEGSLGLASCYFVCKQSQMMEELLVAPKRFCIAR